MSDKLVRFFNKIEFRYNESDFIDADVEKVIVNKKTRSWEVFIKKSSPFDIKVINELKSVCSKGIDEVDTIMISLSYDLVDDESVLSALQFYMSELARNNPSLSSFLDNEVKIVDDVISLKLLISLKRML